MKSRSYCYKQHVSLYSFFGRAEEWTHGGMDCRMRPMAVIQCNAMAFDAAAEARPFVMATVCMYIKQGVAKVIETAPANEVIKDTTLP